MRNDTNSTSCHHVCCTYSQGVYSLSLLLSVKISLLYVTVNDFLFNVTKYNVYFSAHGNNAHSIIIYLGGKMCLLYAGVCICKEQVPLWALWWSFCFSQCASHYIRHPLSHPPHTVTAVITLYMERICLCKICGMHESPSAVRHLCHVPAKTLSEAYFQKPTELLPVRTSVGWNWGHFHHPTLTPGMPAHLPPNLHSDCKAPAVVEMKPAWGSWRQFLNIQFLHFIIWSQSLFKAIKQIKGTGKKTVYKCHKRVRWRRCGGGE